MKKSHVRVWEEDVVIPTYGIGEPDKNPMFLEKRVYQGSSGKVYPHPVIDRIDDEKQDQSYHLVFLENDYLHIAIMPELGGRIYRALDKTNGYDFVYYNHVIKPALVGLTGPWISGGIEFNWPQHHRPNTFGPVEHTIMQQDDGSATVWVSEIDRMYGTKMTAGFTLYPGKAYVEIQVQLYNRTPQAQTFLWWANPAVAVNEQTQSIFPPDVHAVFDHGKRDVSSFPIATGTYYKVDYSAGVDISRYKNIPVPTSYMAYHSDYDFVGGYDYGAQAGILHIANHHISPGKKQWTWGNGDFGQAWDRNLTDSDGPYIELMTGVYTDNQPDFSWLQPYEEKAFKQYFMPYKQIGVVKNASIDAALHLSVDESTRSVTLQVYATTEFPAASITLKGKQHSYLDEVATLSPTRIFTRTLPLEAEEQEYALSATVTAADGHILTAYAPERPTTEIPAAARPLSEPAMLKSNEALYLAGLHLEQYRHATFEPEHYYLEGLKRDSSDIRINIAYGVLLLRRGVFKEAETHFRAAIASQTRHNPNPYDSEAYYQLGLALQLQGELDAAFAAFYKASWSAAWQALSYFALAQIASTRQEYQEALTLVERALILNTHNYKARALQAALLRRSGCLQAAREVVDATLKLDITDFGARNELYLITLAQGEIEQAETVKAELARFMRNDVHTTIALASDYISCGLHEEGSAVLQRLLPSAATGDTAAGQTVYPMLYYYLGYCARQAGHAELAQGYEQAGSNAQADYCFPNSLYDLLVLESASAHNPTDAMAHYYLGNLLYDKKRSVEAIQHWETARDLLPLSHPASAIIRRNLALAYYNKAGKPELALSALEAAFACNNQDARVLFELDQLYKKLNYAPAQRRATLEQYQALVAKRDDLFIEYLEILNTLGQYEHVIQLIAGRIFHPWEGGEGKVVRQYITAHVELGKVLLAAGRYQEAIAALEPAHTYPDNLGEGKLQGAQENNINYYLGCAYAETGQTELADDYFQLAAQGLSEPTSAMFYNDQPPDMIFYQGLAWLKRNNSAEANQRFHTLISYGESHLAEQVKINYFAVSLPDFAVFEDNLQRRNELHCSYMIGLGKLGLQEKKQARSHFEHVLQLDPSHQGATIHLKMCAE
ncbi:DUF5107 domain-containing protein [Ktedonobacteria bacterium brp13]|nr:DUF5107 domain-containing protein [Ktedonobacteria bacterium brp13]